MKKNPFYAMSAAAMLFGCYMVNHALDLEPGRLGRLLALMGVLQVYEALLIALGAYLVATRRAPRDGVTVLVLETLFLLDATLLATECVTANSRVGSAVAVALIGLVIAKLAVVRHYLPETLPRSAAVFLGAQATLVLGLPVAVVHLASARLLAPVSLYGLWWITLGLPVAQRALRQATAPSAHADGSPRAHELWTWIPAASLLIHFAAVGWIHQVQFHLAFLAPLLLGLAISAERAQVVRQIILPGVAVLVTLGQAEALGFSLLVSAGPWISPLRIATLGAGAAYAILAWRHGYPWLVGLAAASGLAGLLGTSLSGIGDITASLLRLVGRVVPRNAFGWGLTGVGGAFVFLALGVWRSLRHDGHGRPSPPTAPRRPLPRHRDIAVALLLAALSAGSMLWAIESHSFGHPRQRRSALASAGLAAAALVLGARAQSRASLPPGDATGRQAASLALLGGIGMLVVSLPISAAGGHHPSRSESTVIADIRAIVSAQAAYRAVNGGHADGTLACLTRPSTCIPGYAGDPPSFLDDQLTSLGERKGYKRFFHAGVPPEEIPQSGSPTSVATWAYVAVPSDPGYTGVRGFCADSNEDLCFTTDGTVPPLRSDGTCDLDLCFPLE